MNPSILLSDNDWDDLRCHLLAMREYTLTRSMGDVALVASVEPVDSPAWRVSMVIGIIVTYRDRVDRQWFDSAESAKRSVRGWSIGG